MSFFTNIGFRWLSPFRPSPLPFAGGVCACYGQSAAGASITQFNLFTAGAAGLYAFNYYIVVRRAATTSSSISPTFSWNDGVQNQSNAPTSPTNTLGNFIQGTVQCALGAGQAVKLAATYASSGATSMQYDIYVSVEKL